MVIHSITKPASWKYSKWINNLFFETNEKNLHVILFHFLNYNVNDPLLTKRNTRSSNGTCLNSNHMILEAEHMIIEKIEIQHVTLDKGREWWDGKWHGSVLQTWSLCVTHHYSHWNYYSILSPLRNLNPHYEVTGREDREHHTEHTRRTTLQSGVWMETGVIKTACSSPFYFV